MMNVQFAIGGAQAVDYAIIFSNRTWLSHGGFYYSSDPDTLDSVLGSYIWREQPAQALRRVGR